MSVFTKLVGGSMIAKASIIDVIKICLSFDFINSTLKISELESRSGPVFYKQNKISIIILHILFNIVWLKTIN